MLLAEVDQFILSFACFVLSLEVAWEKVSVVVKLEQVVAAKRFCLLVDYLLGGFEPFFKPKELLKHFWVLDVVLPVLHPVLLELVGVHRNEVQTVEEARVDLMCPCEGVFRSPALRDSLADSPESFCADPQIFFVENRLNYDRIQRDLDPNQSENLGAFVLTLQLCYLWVFFVAAEQPYAASRDLQPYFRNELQQIVFRFVVEFFIQLVCHKIQVVAANR